MGNTDSELREEEKILRCPQEGKASPFYWACRNNDIESVEQILPTIPFSGLNRLELNGSTPLHAATFFGHKEIIGLLLHDRGCRRDRRNRHELTACQEAQTDEIRQLFYRPQERNRFCDRNDESVANTFQVATEEGDDYTLPNDQWLVGLETAKKIKAAQFHVGTSKTILQSKLLVSMLKKRDSEKFDKMHWVRHIRRILLDYVTPEHPEYEKCGLLVDKYLKTKGVDHLIHLYTLETPFYQELRNFADPLTWLLFMSLDKLRHRYFKGESYRGVEMSNADLQSYRWALKNNGVIKMRTFCSTSLDQSVAEGFATAQQSLTTSTGKQSVLMVFSFVEKCDTAIYLGKIPSANLPCISEYENEAEILLIPWALFTVKKIEATSPILTIINIENVPVKPQPLLATSIGASSGYYDEYDAYERSLETKIVYV